jgi:putative membrane protein
MSEGDFFSDEAKRATRASVESAEAQTCAEIVVAVRKSSARYGVLAYHFGLGFSALVVAYLLLVPEEYSAFAIAFDGIVAFALGALLAANLDTLKRALSRGATLDENVSRGARAAFFDLGISRTSGRHGLLVYASMFERRCVVLTDIGIDDARLGPAFMASRADLSKAVERRDLTAFQGAIAGLGAVLCGPHPRAADDVNELPDEVQ